MKKIGVKELKKIQLEILDYVAAFCKKNGIAYWLNCGTLLGAIRHEGYIPWDDDVDISMTRDDYEKFMKLFNKSNKSKYRFSCIENTKWWPYAFGKVLDTSTILYEPNKKNGFEFSVYVDVFPMDKLPNDPKKIARAFKKRNIYLRLNSLQKYKEFYYEKKNKYNFLRYPLHLFMKLFPDGCFIKKCNNYAKSFRNIDTKYIGNMVDRTKQFCNKNVLDSFINVKFEKKSYPVPKRYDKLLKSFYGDYMKLPPKEMRVSHHRFEAYYKKEGKDNEKA